jgi:sulfate permease, SulP family
VRHLTCDELRIGLAETDGTSVVRLGGDAGFPGADRLADALAAVAARRPRRVVIDLSDLTFISSLAIGVLVTFKYRLIRQGGAIMLVGARPRIEETLRAARVFDDVLTGGAAPAQVN